jgi:hypothetical protein
MPRQARIAGLAVLLAACLGSGLAAQADAKRPPGVHHQAHHRQAGGRQRQRRPSLTVKTKFWEVDSLKQDVWHTVFRTVHVGDEVQAWEHDALNPDDRIGSNVVTASAAGPPRSKATGRSTAPSIAAAPADRRDTRRAPKRARVIVGARFSPRPSTRERGPAAATIARRANEGPPANGARRRRRAGPGGQVPSLTV